MAAAFPTPNYVNPETRVPELLGVQIALTTFAFLIVTGRIFTRVRIMGFWGADDVAISVGMIMAIVETTLACMASRYGTGLHIWDVPPGLSLSTSLKMSFVVQILYMPILLTTKISILLFYLRLSPNAVYKQTVKIVLCFSVAFGIAVTFSDIFQCKPVAFMFDSTIAGKCINQMLFFKSTAIINIVNDFVVFVLPLHTLWKLKLPNAQKVALCFILSLGIFVCIASCVRLSFLFRLTQTNDVTWFAVDLSNWSCIEYNVGIICASLPALKPLMSRLLPTIFGRTTIGSSGNSGLAGTTKKSGNMYALGSMGGHEHYRGTGDFAKADYGVAVSGRKSDDIKDNESEEHIINYGSRGITKTMDITVDVEERSRSGSTIRDGQV